MDNFVNPVYSGSLDELKNHFKKNSSIQLMDFFSKNICSDILANLEKLKFNHIYSPEKFSYFEAVYSKNFGGFFDWLYSDGKNFIELVTGSKGKLSVYNPQYFGHGNYVLMHDYQKLPNGVIFFFDFTNDWLKNFGGETVYNFKTPLVIYPSHNSLTIIRSKKDLHMYIKYINKFAKNKRRYLIGGVIQ